MVSCRRHDVNALKKEAEYYGITPLLNRLSLCCELTTGSCGGVLFHGFIPPPELSLTELDNVEAFKHRHDLQCSGGTFHSSMLIYVYYISNIYDYYKVIIINLLLIIDC